MWDHVAYNLLCRFAAREVHSFKLHFRFQQQGIRLTAAKAFMNIAIRSLRLSCRRIDLFCQKVFTPSSSCPPDASLALQILHWEGP